MAVNEYAGSRALDEPKKVLGELVFRDAKHFSMYFIKRGLKTTLRYTIKPVAKTLYKKSYGGVKRVTTGKFRTQYDNDKFLKLAGDKKLHNASLEQIAGLSDKDFEKVTADDILKELSKKNVKFAVVQNSYTGEVKVKMFSQDMHIFENVREGLIKKLQKEKGLDLDNKKHKINDFLKSKHQTKEQNIPGKEKVRDRGMER